MTTEAHKICFGSTEERGDSILLQSSVLIYFDDGIIATWYWPSRPVPSPITGDQTVVNRTKYLLVKIAKYIPVAFSVYRGPYLIWSPVVVISST